MRIVVSTAVVVCVLLGATAAGAVTAAPQWQTANSSATGEQRRPAIAANRNGYVAVVWEDDRDSTNPGDNTHSEITLRVWRDGTALYEVTLSGGGNTGVTNWRHLSPDVGLDDKGNAVVVWAGDPDGNGFFNIPYRVVNTAGTVTASGQANSSTTGQQVNPKVAVDPDGAPNGAAVAFTAVWEDLQGTNPATVKAAGFTGPTTRAYEVTASQSTGQHHNADVAVSAGGEAVVVWDEDADANGFYQIGLTRLAKTNGAITLTRRSANANGGGQQRHPAVAATFTGDFAVAWESDHTGSTAVWTRSFTAAGNPLSGDIQASTTTAGTGPAIGVDDQGNTVVGWSAQAADPDVWARGFGPDGTDTGRLSEQQLMRVTPGTQQQPAVAVSAFGEVSAAYRDDNDGNGFGQIYLGLGVANAGW
jgi:hypothetical protein